MACLVNQALSVCTSARSSYVSLVSSAVDYEEDTRTDDGFFDMICKCQGKRLDDQRTSLPAGLAVSKLYRKYCNEEDDLLEVLCRMQSSRIEDQRCVMGAEPPHIMPERNGDREGECLNSDDLFELIFRCQSSRINDQRCAAPTAVQKSTMPSEDFFNLIQHLQSTRIEDQRSPLPVLAN